MIYRILLLWLNLLMLASCAEQTEPLVINSCQSIPLDSELHYNELLADFPSELIARLVEVPDTLGALGRNKDGYFHVRFQMQLSRLTDYAVTQQSRDALEAFARTLRYAFSYQQPTGDFAVIIPDHLLNSPDYQAPSTADLASGTAFFAASLGLSLLSLQDSEWFTQTASIAPLRAEIAALRPQLASMLAYLQDRKGFLQAADARAPNRLLFDAIAFYSLGRYLQDQEAQQIGIAFAQDALRQRDSSEGYFIEGGGWDSSYNGVAIKLGFELFTLIPVAAEPLLKTQLAEVVSCAAHWQVSRILPSGEISTEGNTRVFPGGETFLGQEKGVDVIRTVEALFSFSTLTGEESYAQLAQRVIAYYQ